MPKPNIPTYEYLKIGPSIVQAGVGQLSQDEINDLGAQGWLLISHSRVNLPTAYARETEFIFVRPLGNT